MPEPSKTQRQPLSFTATDWKDDKAGGTPITAAQLNRVEKGIADAVKGVNDANERVLTFLVQSDGEHATQDINGAAITAPCQIYSIDEKKTWVDDGTGARVAPFATAEEMKTVRDSLSRKAETGEHNDDMNGLLGTGLFRAMNNPRNAPIDAEGTHWYVMQIVNNSNWRIQYACTFFGTHRNIRVMTDGSWGGWERL